MGAPLRERKNKHKKFNREFGLLIKTARKLCGYTQEDLINDLGSVQMISGIETGKSDCSLYTLYKLIHFLGITSDELIELLYDKRFMEEVTTLEIKVK